MTPDVVLKAHQQSHQEEMDKAKLELEAVKLQHDQENAQRQHELAKSKPGEK